MATSRVTTPSGSADAQNQGAVLTPLETENALLRGEVYLLKRRLAQSRAREKKANLRRRHLASSLSKIEALILSPNPLHAVRELRKLANANS